MSIKERVHPNLVPVFHSNIEIFTNRLDRIIANVEGVPIGFDVEDLKQILGTESTDFKI